MKKFLMILPCLIALGACDKINFHEKNIKCLFSDGGWLEYDSLDINSKKAVLDAGKPTEHILERYVSNEYPEDVILYKSVNNNIMPQYLHFVDNEHYTIGTDLNTWYECRKN